MRPLRLKVSNFLSYRGEHQVDLDGITLAVLSGPNGAGKSTLIDAMRFALFGHTRGGLDGVITEGEQACRVEFAFALGEDHYLVSRSRSRKGGGNTLLSFQMLGGEGAVVLDGKTVPDTQARIEQTLRLTDDLFTVTACANQGNAAAFSQAKPARRKEVLGDIVDLATWERRAEVARQWGRDLAARMEADGKRHEALCAAASGADALREQIAQNDAAQGDVGRQLGQAEGDLAQAQEAKEALLRDREADRARRKELEDLTGRASRIQAAIDEATTRVSQLEKTVSGKAAVLDGIRRAEEAQTYSQELEAKRQEAERLDNEIRLLKQQIEAAEQTHQASVRELEREITHLQQQHRTQIERREDHLTALRRQAELLGQVPCVQQEQALAEACPLLAQAREADVQIGPAQRDLDRLREEAQLGTPWADHNEKLVALREARPGAEHKGRLSELTAARKAVVYDAKGHGEAKRRAGRLQELQDELRRIERAEAQMHELLTALESRTTEAKEITGRIAALEKELGPARNWEAMLAQVDRSISTARQKLRDLQEQAQSLQAQRGALVERLRAAEEAASQAEQLAAELAEGERRLKLLKILAQAFSKQGIPALLIEKSIPDLEAVANDVLSTLSDGRMSLRLVSQRETKAKMLQETLDIVIADERGERAYENFSGGEAMRVDLALRIALSVLLASRAGARCELLVLDETAAPLDVQGRALFVECLQKVAERFATILVITHVEELKDLFPFRFEVSKNAEGSSVEMVAR